MRPAGSDATPRAGARASNRAGRPAQESPARSLSRALHRALERTRPNLAIAEVGRVVELGEGVVLVDGLPRVRAEELLELAGGHLALALDLGRTRVGAVLLDRGAVAATAGSVRADDSRVTAGQRVRRTGRVADVPVGEALLGRVVDAAGRPLDGAAPLQTEERRPVEREAPSILSRAPVETPLQTGITAVDAMIPIGRGQRELIVGDRKTGKTAVAVAAMLEQRGRDVVTIYCAIGQRSTQIAQVIEDLRRFDALGQAIVVASTGDDPAGLQYLAPYAATTIGEYFMGQGRDVLVVYDDITQHARAYRQLSLLLRRPPGREAFPGDIFYIHARLLERATHLRGGGSLTALPIVETQAQNIAGYIPTNLISITDGQIVLSPRLFEQGILPAVDVGRSVSRVGGSAQLPAYRSVVGDLRLAYAQFEELERFSRYGAHLDEHAAATLERGRRIRAVLGQGQYQGVSETHQIALLVAALDGLFDELPLSRMALAKRAIGEALDREGRELDERINGAEPFDDATRRRLLSLCHRALDRAVGSAREES